MKNKVEVKSVVILIITIAIAIGLIVFSAIISLKSTEVLKNQTDYKILLGFAQYSGGTVVTISIGAIAYIIKKKDSERKEQKDIAIREKQNAKLIFLEMKENVNLIVGVKDGITRQQLELITSQLNLFYFDSYVGHLAAPQEVMEMLLKYKRHTLLLKSNAFYDQFSIVSEKYRNMVDELTSTLSGLYELSE